LAVKGTRNERVEVKKILVSSSQACQNLGCKTGRFVMTPVLAVKLQLVTTHVCMFGFGLLTMKTSLHIMFQWLAKLAK
jgi:hypothetical protein